jgi:hypothetical protein
MVVESLVTKGSLLKIGGRYELIEENESNYVVMTELGYEVGFRKGYFKKIQEGLFSEISDWCFSHGIGEGDQGTLKILVDRYAMKFNEQGVKPVIDF